MFEWALRLEVNILPLIQDRTHLLPEVEEPTEQAKRQAQPWTITLFVLAMGPAPTLP